MLRNRTRNKIDQVTHETVKNTVNKGEVFAGNDDKSKDGGSLSCSFRVNS